MKTDQVIIANLKCGGCESTIKRALSEISGVQSVTVSQDEDAVTIVHSGVDRETLTKKLRDLGYPEATEENGLLLKLKSYASCVVGRVRK